MQALAPSPGTSSMVTLGIHDLLEQSITRSRQGTGASNYTAAASPGSSTNSKLRPSSGTPRPQSRNGKLHECADLQAASQAATPRASIASCEGTGNGNSNHTAMPARRQLKYHPPGSKTNHTVNFSRTDRSAAKPQVYVCIKTASATHEAAHSTNWISFAYISGVCK